MPGISSRCLVRRFVRCQHGRSGQPGVSNSREWESATSRSPPSGGAMRRAKALPSCVCSLPCTAVGARLLWWLVTAKLLPQAARATTKVVTGFVPVQVMSRPRWTASAVPVASSLAGRCERASRERLGCLWHDVVAASLPLGAALGATSMGSSSHLGLLSKVRRLFG